MFLQGFALVEDGMVQGVCVFGATLATIEKHAFRDRDFRLFELVRLVVQTKTKNASSFLVGNALRMLEPQPCAVISYADSEQSHCGFIYQATNWLYTGATVSHSKQYIIDGKRVHERTLHGRGIRDPMRWAKDNGTGIVSPHPKHRYFFFCGSKSQKKAMRSKLVYPIVDKYPKEDPKRYDDGPILEVKAETQIVFEPFFFEEF